MRATILTILLVALGCGLAGCGTGRVTTVTVTYPGPPAAGGHAVGPGASTGPVAHGRGEEVSGTVGPGFALPRSPHQTQCEASKGTTEIIVVSEPLQVGPVCQVQIRKAGWKPGYESEAPVGREYLFCYLRNGASTAVESVLDTLASQRGARVCQTLIRKGDWVETQAYTTACRIGGTIYAEPPGTRCS